jgi:hypothetical protein
VSWALIELIAWGLNRSGVKQRTPGRDHSPRDVMIDGFRLLLRARAADGGKEQVYSRLESSFNSAGSDQTRVACLLTMKVIASDDSEVIRIQVIERICAAMMARAAIEAQHNQSVSANPGSDRVFTSLCTDSLHYSPSATGNGTRRDIRVDLQALMRRWNAVLATNGRSIRPTPHSPRWS